MKTVHIQIFAMLFAMLSLTANAQINTDKPFVIPELKEWKGKQGEFIPTSNSKIVYPKGNTELERVAKMYAEDYYTMFGQRLTVSDAKASTGDFVLGIGVDKKLGKEGYQIKITDRVTISAPESVGVFWATRTLLQIAEQNDTHQLPKGEIRDFPDYPLRGFMMDAGRKFIPLHLLTDYVKIMAYYKMNTFHIHLNDNGFKQYFQNDWSKTYAAFRLESSTYPGLTAQDGSYSKKEFIDLQILAENNFVEIIPEIDVPAHSLAFAHYKTELGSEEYGLDHLDLFNPETYSFLDGLFKEYLEGDNPVFRGKRVHVGTDEYSNKKKEVVEKFRYFTDYCIKLVEKYDKTACIWGALTHAKGDTPVKSEGVDMWAWHNPYAQADTMKQLGYNLVSIPDGLLYIVPNAGYYYNYLNCKRLYETWTPAHIGKIVFEERDPKVLGGMFAVWNDHVGNGISTKDIHHRVLPAFHTLAVKMWTGVNTTVPYDVFDKKRENISEAPGVNVAGKIGKTASMVYEQAILNRGVKTGHVEIGYNYTVTFDIDGADETKGTTMFSSPDTEFYLSDPISGMLGFARDGYLNTFNYSVKKGEKVSIKICGDNEGTRFYINGKLRDDLNIEKRWYNAGKSELNYTRTLVFPLKEVGNFNSKITSLKVYNYCQEDKKVEKEKKK